MTSIDPSVPTPSDAPASPSRRGVLAATGASAAAAAAGLVAGAAPAGAASTDRFPLRLPEMPLHDPFVVADERTQQYYLYTSNVPRMTGVDAIGTMVYRSRDLTSWSRPEVVFRLTPDLWATDGAWAPEVHEHDGRYYLFTTVHNPDMVLPRPPAGEYGTPVQTPSYLRGTITAVSDSLRGPFEVLDPSGPVTPRDFMALDGTLFRDERDRPWMVYAHEWLQKIDGTIEALPLTDDLSAADGDPIYLFKGSDASWISAEMPPPSANQIVPYVTDGPQLYRLPGGALAMLWSTYQKNEDQEDGSVSGEYVQTYAVSRTGKLRGPWSQRRPLVRRDSGHGMIFWTLRRQSPRDEFGRPGEPVPLIVMHRPFNDARGKIYEIELLEDGLRIGAQRTDLDGGG